MYILCTIQKPTAAVHVALASATSSSQLQAESRCRFRCRCRFVWRGCAFRFFSSNLQLPLFAVLLVESLLSFLKGGHSRLAELTL